MNIQKKPQQFKQSNKCRYQSKNTQQIKVFAKKIQHNFQNISKIKTPKQKKSKLTTKRINQKCDISFDYQLCNPISVQLYKQSKTLQMQNEHSQQKKIQKNYKQLQQCLNSVNLTKKQYQKQNLKLKKQNYILKLQNDNLRIQLKDMQAQIAYLKKYYKSNRNTVSKNKINEYIHHILNAENQKNINCKESTFIESVVKLPVKQRHSYSINKNERCLGINYKRDNYFSKVELHQSDKKKIMNNYEKQDSMGQNNTYQELDRTYQQNNYGSGEKSILDKNSRQGEGIVRLRIKKKDGYRNENRMNQGRQGCVEQRRKDRCIFKEINNYIVSGNVKQREINKDDVNGSMVFEYGQWDKIENKEQKKSRNKEI